MTLLPKKHPWIVMVILYVFIISGWITFIILAKQRHTTRLSPEEASEIYKQHQESQQAE